ncbi:4'-phosphopantetheinyl transferase A [Fulvia fulva]|uniref:holo-[acyl-carrier-protein] synthase n=1 Tax=Passalora fulva TaxID=5499 RepID=A0A9Q8P967_PASFU|nr:4'-phosphopantetheinyl transferase A [Fulvia fulva]KAK4624730.1 4'-phosphopantetheinyl transferase A [Fulvia fulva]KAK4625268.1 4'-phosphopantetheinyl transferase A [Fulvia fulva]UJO17833.1 4'-phosphopantetheinyl transferase A [Fulvia fulva]WPV14755.1 4'-phosphopantetheinyl transferase A [Fulvia fulva]WPV30417.1 4'-phosphopantetheinyl transferase A [Fulvia fulva]
MPDCAISVMSSGLVVSARKRALSQKLPLSLPNFRDITTLMNGLASSIPSTTLSLSGPHGGDISCWLLDTRSLWPGQNIWAAPGAAEAMALISMAEQKTVSTKMFIQDAKMSLGSALLKRLFVSKTLDIAWKDVAFARKGDPKHGKPCAVDAVGRPIAGIDFNVSHQAGLVALIGWNGKKQQKYLPDGGIERHRSPNSNFDPDVMVGVDIVCVNERDDYRTIDEEGLDGWVDIYDFVFSDEERWSMKYDIDYVTLLDGAILGREEIGRYDRCIERNKQISLKTPTGTEVQFNSDLLVDAKLRRFYTFFCYKEAYIKLAGEALLAPWLKQLEFFNVRSPKPGQVARCSTHGQWGEEVDDVEVHMHGQEVNDVRMKIQSFEESFMLSTAIQGKIEGIKVPAFKTLDLRNDVLSYAQKHLNTPPSDYR